MARERTRSKSRKRQGQKRQPSARMASAARNRREDIRAKRRRGSADEGKVIAKIGAMPRREAKGGRPRSDPSNRASSKIFAPRVALGKGGRPRSARLRRRIARRAA
jgi:hypothetical protein